jgi:hypothetical protein
MAVRPKRTYNVATGQWEVQTLWDSRDDDGNYWKDGVQVDSSGRPWEEGEPEAEVAGADGASTPGTGVGGGPLPEVKHMGGDSYGDSYEYSYGDSGDSGSSSSKSVGGGYGKKRKGEESRGQMNLTAGRNRSILTSTA